jgi:type II restriction/modification system DNA methylase subunit YeeA
MTPEQFVAKWQASARNERAAAQEHFIDLCALLGEPTPNSDPDGSTYAFEKGATKATGGEGWADVWRRGCFAWEYKGRHRDLEAAHRQLLQYAGALGNPPLLVVSDIARIVVRTNWTDTVTERREILLDELTDPAVRHWLKCVFSEPDRLRPAKTRAALTGQAAGAFAELAQLLRGRGHDPQAVAHFVNRLVFCLFADDVKLLPDGMFGKLLTRGKRRPRRFADLAAKLFAAMAQPDGELGLDEVPWFNGGLFDDDAALPLEREDIALLERAGELDWAEIDPSIFGTLFERGLDPDKRSQLGAHYTDREKIEKIIDPVIRRPLTAEWDLLRARIAESLPAARAAVEAALAEAERHAGLHAEVRAVWTGLRERAPLQTELFPDLARQKLVRPDEAARAGLREAVRGFEAARAQAAADVAAFLARLRAYRVLDPACGSGNFLYLSLQALKDLELRVATDAEALGLQRGFLEVGPEAVLGIEINPYAAELARVSVWIGHIQWARRHGLPPPENPVLRALDTIECRDAILAADGTAAAWPRADAIVGNPPFLGGKRMRSVLGDGYCEQLFAAYADRVPGEADLVCYWFERARETLVAGLSQRAGLVATNSIRNGPSRRVVERVQRDLTIFDAWSDEPWTVEGAAVRVSLVSFGAGDAAQVRLDDVIVRGIHSNLTADETDLTTAFRLRENDRVAFQGSKKVGPFEVSGSLARSWLAMPSNPNGRRNGDVLRPSWIGLDVAHRLRDVWIVDFTDLSQLEAAFFAEPYDYVVKNVKPLRDRNNDRQRKTRWFGRSGIDLRRAILPLTRFIVTPEVAKHRIFLWAPKAILPDCKLMVVARDDDTTFGLLQSRFHE